MTGEGGPDDGWDDWWVDFFDDAYVELFADATDVEETERAVNDLISLVGVQPGWRVLDAPGGSGRHAVPLALLGCHVTLVDRSPAALATARATAAATPGDLRVVDADLTQPLVVDRRGRHGPPFDLVANLFNSFGYFSTRDQDRSMLRGLAELVAPRGRFVMEVANPAAAIAQPRHERQSDRVPGAEVTIERRYDTTRRRLTTNYRIDPHGGGPTRTTATVQRLWTADELTAELDAGGLVVDAVLGDLDRTPLDADADWLVLVARRR